MKQQLFRNIFSVSILAGSFGIWGCTIVPDDVVYEDGYAEYYTSEDYATETAPAVMPPPTACAGNACGVGASRVPLPK